MKYCGGCGVLLSDDFVNDLRLRGMPCPNCRQSNYFPVVVGETGSPIYARTRERISKQERKQ